MGSDPWRRAPFVLLRHRAALLAVLGAGAVMAVVGAGQVAYVSSSASAALDLQFAQRCPWQQGAWMIGSVPIGQVGAQDAMLERTTSRRMASAGVPGSALGPPVTTLALRGLSVSSGAGSVPVTLYARTGQLGHVHVDASAKGDGLWVVDDLARQLHLHLGDKVTIGTPITPSASTSVTVTGIYTNLQDEPQPLPTFWCSQQTGNAGYIGPPDSNFPPPTLAMVDTAVFTRVTRALGIGEVRYQWQRPVVSTGMTLAVAGGVQRILSGLVAAYPPGDFFGDSQAPVGAQPTDTAFISARAAAIATSVDNSLSPVTLAGVLIALALIASAGSYWVDRRRIEVMLLRSRGVPPALIALKAVFETSPWVAVGTAMGYGLAVLFVDVLGPSATVQASALVRGGEYGVLSLVLGLSMLGVVVAWRSRSRRAGQVPRMLRLFPWELLVLAAAALAWWRLSGSDADVAPVGASVASVGPLYLAFPLLFVTGTTALVVRAWVALLPWLRRGTRGARTVVFLAVSRLAAEKRIGAVLWGSASLAAGMLLFAAALTSTQRHTIEAKAETFVGATTAADLAAPIPVPQALRRDTTEVEQLPQALIGNDDVELLGVDPATFARGAFWDRSFGAATPGDVLRRLAAAAAAPHPAGDLPVIVANGTLPRHAKLDLVSSLIGPQSLSPHVVAQLPEFSGANGSQMLLVTDARLLAPYDAEWALWSHESPNAVLDAVRRSSGHVDVFVSASSVLDTTTFLPVTWSFSYLQALGVLVGLIALAAMLLYLETRRTARTTAFVLARRMGLSGATYALAVAGELVATLVGGALCGAALGWAAAALVFGHLDPFPDLPPPSLLAFPGAVAGGALAAAVLSVGAASIWSWRTATAASPAIVMRGEA
ncbi:MAG: FtsX-like permease family protein [Acidimicrobiales bacterium]